MTYERRCTQAAMSAMPATAQGTRVAWVRPMPEMTELPPKNLKEALDRLSKMTPPHRYPGDVASALRRMGEVIGKPLARIPTDPVLLRELIASSFPANEEVSQRRWRRVCSLVRTFLRSTGIELEPGRNTAGHSEPWKTLQLAAGKGVALATSRFASFCTLRGVQPNDVTLATFDAFGEAMRDRSLQEKPDAIVRNTVTHWNRAVREVEGWPQLVVPQQRHKRFYSQPLTAYPESFQQDIDGYLAPRTTANLFSADYKRQIKTSTRDLRRRQLRLAAALLVETGFPSEQLTSLTILVSPDNVEAALQRHIDRKFGEATHSLSQIANLLAQIGARLLDGPVAQKRLKTIAENIATHRKELGGGLAMTQRNRDALRQFDLPSNVMALLTLPDRVFAEARNAPRTPAQARRVMLALAVELFWASALRGANVVSLEVERHFSDIRQGRTVLRHLLIPASEMKGAEPFELPLPDRSRAMLDEYLASYWSVLTPEGSPYLFPGKSGRVRNKTHFAQAITAFVQKETGLKIHVHLFRHLAVKLHLERHPDDIETPRRFLQHKSSKTTLAHYTEVRSDRAFATWHQTLASERAREWVRHAAHL